MKTLKLIVLMLLTANFVMAQNTFYGTGAGDLGTRNSNFGEKAGENAAGSNNSFFGAFSGRNAATSSYSVGVGYGTLSNGAGTYNVAIGNNAAASVVGNSNVFIGGLAGRYATVAPNPTNGNANGGNVGIGYSALANLTTASNNLAIGNNAGGNTTTGWDNMFMGIGAGRDNVTGSGNTYIGAVAGNAQDAGQNNIAVGSRSGQAAADGSSSIYNVFLGVNAGKNRPTSNGYELYIQSQHQNSTNTIPLIYGNFNQKRLGIDTDNVPADYTLAVNGNTTTAGRMSINTTDIPLDADQNPYTLAVKGKAMVEEVQVMLHADWPDYVFAEDYDLMSLNDLEAEIETLGHLPGVPSAEEVEENGHALGNMDAILLEKVEELTLHLIDMNKEMAELRERNEALETRLSEVEGK